MVEVVPESEKSWSKDVNEISPQLWPIFRILRIFGAYPIIFKNPAKMKTVQTHPSLPFSNYYKESQMILKQESGSGQRPLWFCAASSQGLISITFWYTFFMCLFNLFIWVTGLFNLGFDHPFPGRLLYFKNLNYSSPTTGRAATWRYVQFLTKATHIAEILTKLFEFIAVLSNIKILVKFLNSWHYFQLNFQQTFKNTRLQVDVKVFRNLVFIFFVFPLTICWAVTCHYGVYPTLETTSGFATICLLWTTALMGVYSLVEDTKLFVVLRTVQQALEQVKLAILNEKNSRLGSNSLKTEDVIQWHLLIRQVKQQCRLVEEWLGSQQLVLIIQTILLSTGYLCSILHFLGEPTEAILDNMGYLLACIGVCINLLGRVYLRTVLAEMIYKEDRAIASQLIEMALETSDTGLQSELKSTAQIMMQMPIQIRFGNYVVLDKTILTKIFVQVITYLIIILQFANSNISNSLCEEEHKKPIIF